MENSWNALNQLWNQSHLDLIFFISSANRQTKSEITDTKLYVPVVTLSTQDHAKLLEQLKSGFKKRTNWNKYQTKISTEGVIQYLDS